MSKKPSLLELFATNVVPSRLVVKVRKSERNIKFTCDFSASVASKDINQHDLDEITQILHAQACAGHPDGKLTAQGSGLMAHRS